MREIFMKIIRQKALSRSSKVLLILSFSAVLLIPLTPLAVKGLFFIDKPEFCISCHMMTPEYKNWSHSSHRVGAGCSDCHVPQQSIVTKLAGKMRDGLNHGYAYAFNQIPDPIRIKKHGAETVLENCIRCHGKLMASLRKDKRRCWDCHRGIPHGY